MTETFAPQVVVNGVTVTPEGWMWTLGFAMGGCQWAIDIVEDPAYDLRGKMIDYNKRRDIYFTEQRIARLHTEIDALFDRLASLKNG